MPRSDTKNEGIKLSASQIRAVEALLHGQTITAAAKSAGISRETLHRWQREDFEFQAAYNRGRRELMEGIQTRLLVMADQATETVKKSVDRGSLQSAFAVLKGLGVLAGTAPSIGEADPEVLRRAARIANGKAEEVHRLEELISGCHAADKRQAV